MRQRPRRTAYPEQGKNAAGRILDASADGIPRTGEELRVGGLALQADGIPPNAGEEYVALEQRRIGPWHTPERRGRIPVMDSILVFICQNTGKGFFGFA